MTVSNTPPVVRYYADGVTPEFSFGFEIFEEDDLLVTINGVTSPVPYTVLGIGESAGSVRFSTPPTGGSVVILARFVVPERSNDYQTNGDLLAEVLNADLDRIWMAIQGLGFDISRALTAPIQDVNPQMTLPPAPARANKALGFDNSGNPFAVDLIIGSVIAPVVHSISMLRLVSRLLTTDVFALGYYAAHDGGGGSYSLDPADHTSADNGGTVIVAADGGRWKLNYSYSVDLAQFGALGNSAAQDTPAIDRAIASGVPHLTSRSPRLYYDGLIGNGINLAPGQTLEGAGVDYWGRMWEIGEETIRRSDAAGTTIYFLNAGPKVHTLSNVANYRTPKTVGGRTFPFTDFTLGDSVNGAPATPRPFSAAVIVNKTSQLRNIRVCPDFNGIAGYNDPTQTGLGADWDIGVWSRAANDCLCYNVQAVGYWRMAAWLLTENAGDFTTVDNAERANFVKCMGQGMRGLLIRTAPQIPVLANTTTTVDIADSASTRITAAGGFKISGSDTLYSFTGYVMNGSNIQLTGVTPDLPAGLTFIRAPNIGNGVSASMFRDCYFLGLEHASGADSASLGLGESAAFEADGYPLRAVGFSNTKFQVIVDHCVALFGTVSDFWWDNSCQWENGCAIAYGTTEDVAGATQDLRMEGNLQTSVDLSAFNARDAYIPFRQFPTSFTDGSFTIKPWRDTHVRVQTFAGITVFEYNQASGNVNVHNQAGAVSFSTGASGNTVVQGANVTIQNASGQPIINAFGTSQNVTTAAILTSGADLVSTGNVRPATDNVSSCGTASNAWTEVRAHSGSINTSDGTLKTLRGEGTYTDDELAAWGDCRAVVFQFNDAIAKKGPDGARLHAGYIAQAIQAAFAAHGLDASRYGLWCEDTIYVTVMTTQKATRQKMQTVAQTVQVVEIVNGVPTLTEKVEQVEVGVVQMTGIIDSNGNAVLDEDGQPRMYPVPVAEEYDEAVETQQSAGTRLALRYEECLVFETAYLRSVLEKQDARISALERGQNTAQTNTPTT